MSNAHHKHSSSQSHSQNHRAQLANAYNELGKELSSAKIRVVGNYTLGKVIGEGAYGKVRMGTHRLTSARVAIKQIPKAMSAALTREIHHHRQLHHPHITQMYEVIATESSIWIVTELCCGGELFDYLVEKGRLSEDETRIIFGQLCLAVAYLHENGIVHRDLKLENVLLDERCRVKLGDFGFTREFEQGSFMETFCGTTGYASPEMLQHKKYQGPEVDVWSLGVILYTLLTGTLPFDDDDEVIMRAKIIKGDFDDPEWLSLESRDLIKNILQKDVTKRLMIPQILAHPWFTSLKLTYEPDDSDLPLSPEDPSQTTDPDSHHSSDASDLFNNKDLGSPAPTTPDDAMPIDDPFISPPISSKDRTKSPPLIHHRNESESTLRLDIDSLSNRMSMSKLKAEPSVPEEDILPSRSHSRAASPPRSAASKAPPAHPTRTPARTKRRSVSSTLSADNILPGTPLPAPASGDVKVDFSSLLKAQCPVIFSTPQERQLLNTLSALGFDTAQIVHSVLTDACDSAGAVWWMLRKKCVEKEKDDGEVIDKAEGAKDIVKGTERLDGVDKEKDKSRKKRKVTVGIQTLVSNPPQLHHVMAPALAFVPPTPTFVRPVTPPRPVTPTKNPMLSPSTSTVAEYSSRSHPSTPGSSMKDDREGSGSGSIGAKRKPRSGSVSIMQRATTALEAAGLVRKRSSEAVKDKDKDKDRLTSAEEPRSSHGSGGSSKLTKSPPLKAKDKDKEYVVPMTPPPIDPHHSTPQITGSPWVLADPKEAPGEMVHSHSTPNIATDATPTAKSSGSGTGANKNKANILTAFRLWFNEDRKGKRKVASSSNSPNASAPPIKYVSRPVGGQQQYGTKRRSSGSGSKFRNGHHTQRPSLSSRRSSSVNSRRSSGTSVQMIMLDSPQVQTRRSLGAHTPNSERGEYSSRPSSIRSFSLQPRHRKSPSASSAGSITRFRAASPMQSKYHRRGGSGSSTRVVRQIQTNVPRPIHVRSSSAASSIHSPPSSRPTSFYDPSESDGPRTGSPYRSRSRRSTDDTPKRTNSGGTTTTTFIAQKRQGPFVSPVTGRSSWKKAWGLEPPGWQTRTAHLPVEVLVMSPATEVTSIRDVFSGRQSLSLAGDESDWVDEDDDIPAFAGGLGQLGSSASSSSVPANTLKPLTVEPTVTLSPAPRGFRSSNKRSSSASNSMGRQKASPVERISPAPMESSYESDSRAARRSLPSGRPGPAFKHPIQEEDEDEEE